MTDDRHIHRSACFLGRVLGSCAILLGCAQNAGATELIAIGNLTGSSAGSYTDLSGLSGTLENGVSASLLGGIGSGLAYAGGTTFLGLPDRGPNATPYANPTAGNYVDSTTSFIARFQTIDMSLTAAPSGGLPYTLTPTLSGTTLLYANSPLVYGTGVFGTGASQVNIGNGAPALNQVNGHNYFTGRSDGFDASQSSLYANNARLDPESIRVSNDGKSVFVSDEYGPYIYQFDRATGERIRSFALPANLGIAAANAQGAVEISANSSGRVANKGMEGLAITPDGKTLVGFMQSPLAQDGGDGGRMNRIVTIDVATGTTHEYAYDNHLDVTNKNYNSSEILAVNDHQFLVLERDGKGLGDTAGSKAVIKQVYEIDLTGAQDVSGLSGEAALLAKAITKTQFLDLRAALHAFGLGDTQIPAKLEGMAFGQDIMVNGVLKHTLYVANDNDFVAGTAGPNNFYVFAVGDSDLPNFQAQELAPVPLPAALVMFGPAFAGLAALARRRKITPMNTAAC